MDDSHRSYNMSICRSQGQGGGGNVGGVKIGGLWKRSQGMSRFTKPNYKHRVFILTEQALSYYCGTVDRIGQLKGRVPLETIRAVEFVEESAFCLAHTMQVVYQTKKHGFVTLYVTTTDRLECSDWVSTLRQACYFNKDMLMHYHPGAMLKGKWSCCKQSGKTTLGCQPTYHLLTRSSSRYAQMRRKDTLSSSQIPRKRTRSSAGAYATLDRRSLAHSTRTSGNVDVQLKPRTGIGMSNSCVDLTVHPPHRIESFVLEDPTSSQRSSRQSTETVGVASVTLTQVSVGEATSTDCSGEFECVSLNQSSKVEKRHGSRSQVAPESSFSIPMSNFPTKRERHSLEAKDYKVKQSPLAQSLELPQHMMQDNHSLSTECTMSLSPVPPPRQKRLNPSIASSLHGSVHSIPCVSRLSEPNSSRSAENHPLGKLRHSKTFALSKSSDRVAEPRIQPHLKGFSHSMHTLTKPLIKPKLSLTNPNMVHV